MKVELRNITYVANMSEETSCFEGVIYLDGVKACRVSNRGTGGCHDFSDRDVVARMDAYGATLPPHTFKAGDTVHEMPQNAESLVDAALTAYLTLRDLRRDLKKAVLFTKADGKLYQLKPRDKKQLQLVLADVKAGKVASGAVAVLNFMPEPEALKTYLAAGAA